MAEQHPVRVSRLTGLLALLFVLGACGSRLEGAGSPGNPQATASPALSLIASSPAWQQEGTRLRQLKQQINVQQPNGSVGCGASRLPCNAGDYAYQSQPVDIVASTTYTLLFGPVADDYDVPRSPSSVVFSFPQDAKFSLAPVAGAGPAMVTIAGKRFLQVKFQVSNFLGPYPGFTAWTY